MAKYVVTGANRGIGLGLCRRLHQHGHEVIAVCRRPSTELANLGVTMIADIDITDQVQVDQLAATLSGQQVDVLINNAGVWSDERIESLDADSLIQAFAVNAVGPLRVTSALLGCLTVGSKVAFISSRMGSIEDNTTGGRYGYRMSKAALNAAGRSLAIDLKSKGIAVALLHPGHVKTDMGGISAPCTVETSAAGILGVIDQLTVEHSGQFWHQNGEKLPW